jgi:hypothetical protein
VLSELVEDFDLLDAMVARRKEVVKQTEKDNLEHFRSDKEVADTNMREARLPHIYIAKLPKQKPP